MTDIGDGGFVLYDQVQPEFFAYHTFASSPPGVPQIARSKDAGKSWSNESNALDSLIASKGPSDASFYPPLAVDPAVAQRVFFGSDRVYVSTDGMQSWRQQTAQILTAGCGAPECALQDLEFAPSDHTKAYSLSTQQFRFVGCGPSGYCYTSDGFELYNTSEADCPDQTSCKPSRLAKWNQITGNLPFNSAFTQATGIAISPFDPNIAYLSLSGFTAATKVGHIYKTTDFGATWSRADGGTGPAALLDIPVLKVLVDRTDQTSNTIVAGTDIGPFRSTDGGNTWVFDLDFPHCSGVRHSAEPGRGDFRRHAWPRRLRADRSNRNFDPHPNFDLHPNSDSDADRNSHSNPDRFGNADAHRYPNRDADRYSH